MKAGSRKQRAGGLFFIDRSFSLISLLFDLLFPVHDLRRILC